MAYRNRSDKSGVLVLIVAGQSNAVGRTDAADLPANLAAPQDDILFWFEEDNLNPALRVTSGEEWIPLQFQTDLGGNDFFGPEISLGRTAADGRPQREVAIFKFAVGATDLATDWNPQIPASL